MTSVTKDVYIDKFDNTVNRYKNIYHIAVKMKHINVKSGTNIDFGIKNNENWCKLYGKWKWYEDLFNN